MRCFVYIMVLLALMAGTAGEVVAEQYEYFHVQSGTGFMVSRGRIITNAHVVRGCKNVDLSGAVTEKNAEVLGTDEEHDLALIKSESETYNFAPLRLEVDSLKVGDDVIVMGYGGELGLQDRTTFVKAKVEKLELNSVGNPWHFYISNVVQHGNSGGPVLDMAGNVIGVVVGMLQLNTVNSITNEKISEQNMGAVITLRALQQFVQEHGVYVRWSDSSGLLMYGDSTLEDTAKSFVVHVQCRQKMDGPPPSAQLRGGVTDAIQ